MSSGRRHVDSSDEDDDDDADWLRPSVRKAAQGGDIGSDDDDFAVSVLNQDLSSELSSRASSRTRVAYNIWMTLMM